MYEKITDYELRSLLMKRLAELFLRAFMLGKNCVESKKFVFNKDFLRSSYFVDNKSFSKRLKRKIFLFNIHPQILYIYLDYIRYFPRQLIKKIRGNSEWVKKNKRIFLMQTPLHTNLGDQAITVAELKLLYDRYQKRNIYDISYNELENSFESVKQMITSDDLILLHGGGNMGTLWYNEEEIRQKVITTFAHNKIVILPQSIFYEDSDDGNKKLQISQKIYQNHQNLHIIARDKISLELMKKYYPQCKIYLTPDIVFYLERQLPRLRRNDIMFCLRSDKEKQLSDDIIQQIHKIISQKTNFIIYTDTVLNDVNITKENRIKYVEEMLDSFKKVKLVITDRLHGMIFAAITATPCLVLANNYHKIKGQYEWISDLDYIKFTEDLDNIEDDINKLLNLGKIEYINSAFKEKFRVIYDIIETEEKA
jgi:pyruvyl transferase EpsI